MKNHKLIKTLRLIKSDYKKDLEMVHKNPHFLNSKTFLGIKAYFRDSLLGLTEKEESYLMTWLFIFSKKEQRHVIWKSFSNDDFWINKSWEADEEKTQFLEDRIEVLNLSISMAKEVRRNKIHYKLKWAFIVILLAAILINGFNKYL